jgi:GNAT superfamily N-acetyltransferase
LLVGEVTYREATFDDAELAADVMTATYPAMPQDPVMIRLRWENTREGFAVGRFIAECDGRPIAFLAWLHGPWGKLPDRHCEVEVWLDRAAMDRLLLRSMWSWIAERAEAEGARVLLGYAAEDETEALDVLAELGYARERTEKVWELDLAKHGPRLVEEAAETRQRMAEAGITLLTLAEWKDPAKERKLFELNAKTVQDIPHTLPIIPETYADFEKRLHVPDRPPDRYWVACQEDRAVAMSYLKFPPVRGTVWTGYTCTDREFRGRGIARAVKLQTLAQAVELGVPFVCTDNDSENAPMLHINEALGYHRRPGFVEHHKRVTK